MDEDALPELPMPKPTTTRRADFASLVLIVLVGLPVAVAPCGCSTTPDRTPATLDRAESAYRRGDFELASQLASSVEQSSTGLVAEEAAYVHGLATARLGRTDEARRALELASRSTDPDLANRARRSLTSLDGTSTSGVRASSEAMQGGFTVQAGAFSSESAARARAAEVDSMARSAGFGSASVRRISSRRGTLWAVQIGRFTDRRQAGSARDRMGHPEWAVEAIEAR